MAVSTNESRNVFGLSPADQDHILRREAKKLARVRAAYSDPATLAMAQNAKTETARLSDLENKDAELNKVRAKVDGRLNVPEFQDQLVRMADNAGWEEIGGRVIMRDLEGNGRMTAVGRTPWAPKEEWFVGGLGSKEQIQTAVRKAINGEKLGDKQRQIVEYMLDFAGENIITTAQRNYEYDQFFEKHDINGTGNMTEAEMDEFFNSPEFMQPMSILSGVGMPEEGKVLNPEQEALVEFVQDHAGDPDVADAIAVFASSASQLSGMDGSPETISKAFEAKARGDNERQQQEQPISESAQGESTGGIGRGAEWGQTTQGEGILQSYTSEEIAAKEKAAADAASKAAQDAAKAEQKARADAERGDFQLTGSDRPADVAAAAGQNDLFGAGSRKKTNSPEISSSQQTNPPEEAKPDGEIRQESDEDQQDAPLVTYWADRASDLHDVAVVLRDKISDQPNSDGAVAEISHEMVKFQLMTMDHSKGRRPTPEQFKDIADSLEAVISKYTGGQDIDGLIEKYGSFGTKALPKPVKKNVLAEAKAKKQAEEAAAQPKEDQANDNPIIPPEPKEDAPQTTEEPNLLAARDIMDRYKKIVGNKVAEGKIRKEMLALASKTDLNEHPKTAMALDMLATRLGYDGDMGWKESEVKPQSAPAVATAPEHVDLEENAGVSVKGMDDEAANQALVDAAGDSGSAVISQNTKDRPMREQRLIASGEQLYSATGRKISPAPKIDTSSKLKLAGSIKRMNQWLYDEAMKEAVETGSDWNQTLIKGISVKSLSQSDKDTLNQILFGDADGASDKNRSPGNGQPVDPRGKSILKDISAGKEEADHIPDVRKKVEEDKPAILTLSKAKYIDATAKEQGIKKGSPGYDAAIKRLESAYDEDLNKALAALPFDQFHDWNVKDGSKSEAMNRSAWEALREEHGITEAKTESRERKKPDFDPAVFVKIAADSIDKLRPQDVDRVLADAYALGRDQLGGMTQYIMDYNAKLMPQVVEFFEEVAGFLEDTNDKRIKHFVDVGLRRRNAIDLRESIAKNFGEDLAGLQLQGASDRYAFFLPDASNEGKVRVTYFDKNGLSGHTTYDTYAKALDEAIQDGYRTESQGSLERLSELDSFKAGNEWAHKLQAFHDGKITWADFVAGKDANEKQAEAKDPLGVSEERELSDYIASDYRNASNSTAIAGTGWVMHDDSINSAGTIQLVSASRNVIRDIKYDPKSGTDHRRAIVRATVWAQENPDKFEATKEELVSKPEFDPKIESEESSLDQKETIKDFGEKIGGARKDMEIKSSKKVGKKSSDTRPAWERRFEIVEVAASNRPEEVGRWFIYDTKKKDWMGNPVRVGSREGFASKETAEKALPLVAVSAKHRVVPSREEGKYEIWRDVNDRKRVKVVDMLFDSREDAMRYMAGHAVEIIETNTTFGEADLPRPQYKNRTGIDRRDRDVKDVAFSEVFGFRGVEFGNWNNQADRQELLNDAYDGLLDLADVMGIPPKAISLNGELALAFGARGHGLSGARAHYERERVVINLTKENGAGSLAHEWFHALDHYFARQDGSASAEWVAHGDGTRTLKASQSVGQDFASHGTRGSRSGMREELRKIYSELMTTISRKAEAYVEDTARADNFVGRARKEVKDRLDRIRADLSTQKDPKYWKRKNSPATTEQLAEFDMLSDKIIAGEFLETTYQDKSDGKKPKRRGFSLTGMRHTNDALERINAIMKEVRGRQGFTADGKGELDYLRETMRHYSQRIKQLADAQTGTEKTKFTATQFAMDARELDQGRGGDYWTTPHEMAARAFQGFVEDKMADNGIKTPFLNYAPENYGILTPWGAKRPFPHGEERKAINQVFDRLVSAIKTRETGTGLAIEEPKDVRSIEDRRFYVSDDVLRKEHKETEESYGGEAAYLKAKESGKTKLNFRQWVQVRTPRFKEWFGDWEGDHENASKVVDPQTGEPLVVYHGTDVDFSAFDKSKIKSRFPYSFGFHFTDRVSEADAYSSGIDQKNMMPGGITMPVFISAKNPLTIKTEYLTASMEADFNRAEIISKLVESNRDGNPYDAVIISRDRGDEWDGRNVVVFNSTQIKSSIGNSGDYGRDTGNIVSERKRQADLFRKRPGKTKGRLGEDVQADLFDDSAPKEIAPVQARENFFVRYQSVPVGQLRVGIKTISGPEDAAHAVSSIRKHAQETMMAIVVNKGGDILSVIRHSKGIKDASNVSPIELVAAAVNVPDAAGVWLAHNHPSGIVDPSESDERITKKIVSVAEGTGVQVLGHVIVGHGNDAVAFDATDTKNQYRFKIKPMVRRHSVDVTERVIRKVLPSVKSRIEVINSIGARALVKSIEPTNAVILLNTQNHHIGTVAMTADEMLNLRDGIQVDRLMKALDATNAAAVIIKSEGSAEILNTSSFFANKMTRVLDAFVVDANNNVIKEYFGEVPEGQTFYRRSSENGIHNGISRNEAMDVIREFRRKYKGIADLRFRVYETKEQAYGKEALKRASLDNQKISGGYKSGGMHVILEDIADAGELLATLRHEAWAHYGFDLIPPLRKRGVLRKLADDIKGNSDLNGIYEKIRRQYRDNKGNVPSEDVILEEVVASIAELYGDHIDDRAMESNLRAVVRKIIDAIADMLRSVGLIGQKDGMQSVLDHLIGRARYMREGGRSIYGGADNGFESRNGRQSWYYSALKEAAADMKQEKGSPEQMLAMLSRVPGVKPAEIEATGLKEFMQLQGKSVTKQQIMDYLQGNGVQVQETVLGAGNEPTLPDGWEVKFDQEQGLWVVLDQDGDEMGSGLYKSDAMDMAMDDDYLSDNPEYAGDTKYGKHVLPGGENYRELLLTLPSQFKPQAEFSFAQASDSITDGKPVEIRRNGSFYKNATSQFALEQVRNEDGITFHSYPEEKQVASFRSNHYDQPNILAHVRFNERTDADGKRVLFLEELQSDWAQQGRKRGFKGDAEQVFNAEKSRLLEKYKTDSLQDVRRIADPAELQKMDAAYSEWQQEKHETIKPPSAPFVTSTDAWVGLSMKRMISYAAENGFDRIAWTTGEQQADRYDLSKQVKEIDVERYDLKGIGPVADIRAIGLDGRQISSEDAVEHKRAVEIVGKELADKIFAQEPETRKQYAGDDLKVGGEGMKAFYDKIVPKVAKEVTKKMGGQLRYVNISVGEILPNEYRVLWADGSEIDSTRRYETRQEAQDAADSWTEQTGDETTIKEIGGSAAKDASRQPGFDITPEMRSAVESGLPLFRIGETSVQAEQSPLFKTRTADQVGAISKEKADEALKVDATAQKILAKGNVIKNGDLVGVRLNINVLNRTGVPVQSVHKGGEGIRKKMDKPGNQSGFYNGEVLTYAPYAVLKNAYFTVHQPMREKIASGSSSKTPMASADGEWINTDSPSFDGVLARFNPHGEHLFIDQKGRAVKRAEEATIMGHRAYLRGEIEYYQPGEAPAKAGDSATNVTFYDPQQPPEQLDDLFFRRASEGDASAVDVLKTHIQDRLQPSLNTFNWWHKSVGTQFHKAWKDKDYKKVFDKAQNYLNDTSRFAMESADLAPGLLPKVDSFADIMKSTGASRADIEKIADPIYTGTLDDKKVYTNQELSERFGLNDRQRALYREFRKAINHSLDSMVASEIAKEIKDDHSLHGLVMTAKYRPERALEQVVDVLDARAEELESIVKQMEDGKAPAAEVKPYKIAATEARKTLQSVRDKLERLAKMKNEGYAPLMRFGKYTVTVTNIRGEIEYFGMFEKQSDARAMERSMSEEYGIDAQVSAGVMSQEAYKLYAGMSPDTLELFGSSIGFDKSQSDIFQDYLRMSRNNRSALKRLIRRKGTAGFSKDVTRSLASFITSNARQASSNWHLGEMDETIEQIRLNKKEKGDVIDEAVKLRDYLRNPKDEAAAVRNLLFINYIGGSLASALTNMTQPITMTWPYLAQFGNATKHLLAAQKIGFGSKADGDLGKAMERATDEGTLAPHEVYQLHSEAIRNLGSNIYIRKAITAWGRPFALAETYNRRLTFAAAYNMAKENPSILKQARSASPYSFAVKAVQETQGIYNKGNRPNWARGALGATVFTFKQYSISYLEFLQRLPRKQQLQAIGILFLLAGINGLPFGDDIEDLIDTIAQMMGYNLHSRSKLRELAIDTLGETAGDFIVNGASSLPGSPIDVQARMGLGNLIPGTGILKRSTADKTRDVAEAVGPAGGMAMSIGHGIGSLMQGDIGSAAMAAAPNAAKNAVSGGKIWATGQYRDQSGRLIAKDVGAIDGIWKMIGFSPSSIAKESRVVSGERQRIALARDVESKIADRWAEAIVEQDADKLSESKMALADWNEKNPDTPIRITLPQIRQRVRAMGMDRRERLVKSAPKELRGMLQ